MPKQLLLIATLFVAVGLVPVHGQSSVSNCGCEGPLPEALASVNGRAIGLKDLSKATADAVHSFQQQVIDARGEALDLQINSALLDLEAEKRGISRSDLVRREVVAKSIAPTDADAKAWYEENKDQVSGGFESIRREIIDYLTRQNRQRTATEFVDRLRAASDLKKNVEVAPPPATAADRQKVLATVGGRSIKSSDVENSLRALIYSVQRSVYQRRKTEIDVIINDVLLAEEAKKQGTTTAALLKREVDDKLKPVTDADAQKFYYENKDRINAEFASLKPQIIQYLSEQNKEKAMTALADRLRSFATIKYFIPQPVAPVFEISTANQPSKGPATAPVTIVEFVDFQCPRCAQFHDELGKLVDEYKGKVRLVLLDYPLTQHERALKAAEAAEAAREQGKFWEYAAILYKNQDALEVPHLKEYATRLGLDRAKFDAALDSGKLAERIEADTLFGDSIGVSGTPTVFVNGRPVDNPTYDDVKSAVVSLMRLVR